MTLIRRETRCPVRRALATNDLPSICEAIDHALHELGVEIAARKAGLDRTTLYRAFRCKNGPALETMVRVLQVLDLMLVVEVKILEQRPRAGLARLDKTARFLTAAFKSSDLDRVVSAFAKTLSSQENFSEFARRTIRSREALYRSFAPFKRPRFITLLSVLNALELQFSVEPASRPNQTNCCLSNTLQPDSVLFTKPSNK